MHSKFERRGIGCDIMMARAGKTVTSKQECDGIFRIMASIALHKHSNIACHIPALYVLAKSARGPIVECGVGQGSSTLAFLIGSEDKVTSYDIDQVCEFNVRNALDLLRLDNRILYRWIFHKKDSISAASEWENSSVGLLFIDTSHLYQDTKNELCAWLPRMKADGVICGHDYGPSYSGVRHAVDEFVKNNSRFSLQLLNHDEMLFILWPKT